MLSIQSSVVSKYNNRVGGLVGNNEGTIRQCGVSGGSVTYQNTGMMTEGFVGRNTGSVSEAFLPQAFPVTGQLAVLSEEQKTARSRIAMRQAQ